MSSIFGRLMKACKSKVVEVPFDPLHSKVDCVLIWRTDLKLTNVKQLFDGLGLDNYETTTIQQWFVEASRKMGLEVQQEKDVSFFTGKNVKEDSVRVNLVHVPFDGVCKVMEEKQMLRLSIDDMQGQYPFSRALAEIGFYGPWLESREYFDKSECSRVCTSLLQSLQTPYNHSSILPHLLNAGILDILLLHSTKTQDELVTKMMWKPYYDHSLQQVNNYFGSYIGFYFGFLAFYTKWLFPLAIIGLIIEWCHSYEITFDEEAGKEINFNELNTNRSITQPSNVMLGLLVCAWSALFVIFWRRRNQDLAFQWGVSDLGTQRLIHPEVRPEFCGETRVSEVTGLPYIYYPSITRRFKQFLSVPILCIFLWIVFGFLWFSLWIESILEDPNPQSSHMLVDPMIMICVELGIPESMLPTIVNVLSIPLLKAIYTHVAQTATVWENHQTHMSFTNSLLVKLALFNFVNSYLGLCYQAFWVQDFVKLREFMKTLMVTSAITSQVTEVCLPFINKKFSIFLQFFQAATSRPPSPSNPAISDSDPSPKTNTNKSSSSSSSNILESEVSENKGDREEKDEKDEKGVRMKPWELQSKMTDEVALFDEYLEMVIQFGYICMFWWAWPPTAFCCFLNNSIEIRTDMYKIIRGNRRPFWQDAEGIGAWLTLISGLAVISFISTFSFLAICVIKNSEIIEGFIISTLNLTGALTLFELDISVISNVNQMAIVVIGEHVFLGVVLLMTLFIPQIPGPVRKHLARQRYLGALLNTLIDPVTGKLSATTNKAELANSLRSSGGVIGALRESKEAHRPGAPIDPLQAFRTASASTGLASAVNNTIPVSSEHEIMKKINLKKKNN